MSQYYCLMNWGAPCTLSLFHRSCHYSTDHYMHLLFHPISNTMNFTSILYYTQQNLLHTTQRIYHTMSGTRSKVTRSLILFLSFIAFASYHKGTGSTAWLQWLTLIIFLIMGHVFDVAFTAENTFVFDPDADNWRRKTEAVRN